MDSSTLLAWARNSGLESSPSLEIRSGTKCGRGIFTTAPVKQGDLLLRLPFALVVRPAARLIELCKRGECSTVMALALTVLHELRVASPRTPYFEDLSAAAPPLVPLLWAEADLLHLAGTSLLPLGSGEPQVAARAAAAEAKAAAHAAFEEDVQPLMAAVGEDYLPSSASTMPAFEEALACVVSRGLQGRLSYELGRAIFWPCLHANGPPGSDVGPFLLPIMDLLNHTSEAALVCTTLARMDKGGNAFQMHASRDIAAGEEVLISYGEHGTAELLRTYGFTESSRHTTMIVTQEEVVAAFLAMGSLVPRLSCDLQTASKRMDALVKAGCLPVVFMLRGGTGAGLSSAMIPEQLLTAVQVLIMTAEEFAGWLDAGSIPLGKGFLDEGSLPGVMGCLLKVVEHRLRRYPAEEALCGVVDTSGNSAAAVMGRTLREEEGHVLRAFKKAVLMLGCSTSDEEGEEEDEHEDRDDEASNYEDEEEAADDESLQARVKRLRQGKPGTVLL